MWNTSVTTWGSQWAGLEGHSTGPILVSASGAERLREIDEPSIFFGAPVHEVKRAWDANRTALARNLRGTLELYGSVRSVKFPVLSSRFQARSSATIETSTPSTTKPAPPQK